MKQYNSADVIRDIHTIIEEIDQLQKRRLTFDDLCAILEPKRISIVHRKEDNRIPKFYAMYNENLTNTKAPDVLVTVSGQEKPTLRYMKPKFMELLAVIIHELKHRQQAMQRYGIWGKDFVDIWFSDYPRDLYLYLDFKDKPIDEWKGYYGHNDEIDAYAMEAAFICWFGNKPLNLQDSETKRYKQVFANNETVYNRYLKKLYGYFMMFNKETANGKR